MEEPEAVSELGVGVVAPEETGVPTTGGRLESMPVDVCLSCSVEGRVSLVYMHFFFRRRHGKLCIKATYIIRRCSVFIVAGKTFYLNGRRSYSKQAGMI